MNKCVPNIPISYFFGKTFNNLKETIFLLFAVVDDRRRAGAGRREDPRRHTLGTDMLGYGQGQGPPQRAMDLEVNDIK